MFLTQY